MNPTQPPAGHGLLAALVESSEDAILSKDLDGVIQTCNPAAERLFGYTAAELLNGIRVLVVEDEPDTLDFLDRFLKTYGATVVPVNSAPAALALLPAMRPDILVSDIGLPEVDGYDLMQRIRQMGADAGGAIPAIALTAYARTEDRTRAFRAGYQAHLAKPVEPTELVATIASFAELIEAQRRSRPRP